MKRRTRVLLTFLLLISQLLLCRINQAQVDYFAPSSVYEFAEYLYQEEDYLRAAGEFQRYLLLAGTSEGNDSTLFKIGMCYRLGKHPRKAINYFKRIVDKNPQSGFKDQASYQIAYSYFETGQYSQSTHYIDEHYAQSSEYRGKLRNLLVVNHLYLKEWRKAYNISSSFLNSKYDFSDSLIIVLNRLALGGTQLPYKSTIKAGVMSSLVPGTGKMYAHRFNDGLYSLLTIGLAGWQAYDGFSKDGTRSAKGWIYGTLGTVFYLGNIYGSVVAVRIHNQRIEDDFLNEINIKLLWR